MKFLAWGCHNHPNSLLTVIGWQGYDVPLHLDAALMEEDAVAFEHSTVIAANIAADRLAAASQPPLSPPAGIGEPGGNHFCDRCKLDFEDAHSLQVLSLLYITLLEKNCQSHIPSCPKPLL